MAETTERSLVGVGTDSSQDGSHQKDRYLVLEFRSKKVGFVVFEGPARLLDWGVRSYPSRRARRRMTLDKKICFLLDLYAPSVVVIPRKDNSSRKTRKTILSALQGVRTQARRQSITLQSLDKREVLRFFAEHGCATKHQIAAFVAKLFEELSWKLPPKRKAWQSEAQIMLVFDAAATGIAYFGRRDRRE
jgi:hypothetical protein